MTTPKECVTCRDFNKHIWEYPCQVCNDDHNMWSPISELTKTKKMKSTSKRTKYDLAKVLSLITLIVMVIQTLIYKNGFFELTMITILSYSLGFVSRRPHPNEKPLIIWLKICILKVQIWHKQAYLFWYPDLKKYRGNPKRKQKVWSKRDRLKKLNRELRKLV